MTADPRAPAVSIPTAALLDHWQGHRRVTGASSRRFPRRRSSTYSIGGMRPFAAMTFEMISMAGAGIRGIATGIWDTGVCCITRRPGAGDHERAASPVGRRPRQIEHWPQIPAARFEESTRPLARTKASSTACSCTGSTTRSTIAGRDTSICGRWGSSRRVLRPKLTRRPWSEPFDASTPYLAFDGHRRGHRALREWRWARRSAAPPLNVGDGAVVLTEWRREGHAHHASGRPLHDVGADAPHRTLRPPGFACRWPETSEGPNVSQGHAEGAT